MQREPNFKANVSPQKDIQFFGPQLSAQIQHSWPQVPVNSPHIMATPSLTPWNPQQMPWTLANTEIEDDGVLHFNACGSRPASIHHKRKSDLPMPQPPNKQFISEEKITAHFNGLHISSDYIQNSSGSGSDGIVPSGSIADDVPSTSGKCFTNLTYEDYQITAKQLAEKLKNATAITMCEEVLKLQEAQQNVSFLPQVLLKRYDKPCTALIPYVPPPALTLLKQVAKEGMPLQQRTKINEGKMLGKCETEFDDDDIDDFFDNNNTCSMDFNQRRVDEMDEDI